MILQHIALSVFDIEEVENFYINILGMEIIKNFVLKKDLSKEIFNIDQDTPAYILQKNNLFFELFVSHETFRKGFNHICITIENREKLIKKSKAANYTCTRIVREFSDLIFIKDQSGNVFEIKEI